MVDLDKVIVEEDEVFDKKIVEEVEQSITPPDFFSEEWHDYVMLQFREDELKDGHPFRDGLLRVTEKLIGPVAKREIINFEGAGDNNKGTATVHIRLSIVIKNDRHPLYDGILIEDGIAEVNSRNTPHPFFQHPAATASSKAESQALRKALRLRQIVAAEEITPKEMEDDIDVYTPEVPIEDEQIMVIDLLCKRINISLLDFINSGQSKYIFLGQVPSSKARSMIKFLNEIQSGKQKSPVVKPYDKSWREKDSKKANNEVEDEGTN